MKTKTNPGAVTLPVTHSHTRERVHIWRRIAHVYNHLPLGITPCKTTYEAKMYTAVLLCVLSFVFLPLLLPAISLYRSAKKGGRV